MCWDVVCYLRQEVHGQRSVTDVRKNCVCICFSLIFNLLTHHVLLIETIYIFILFLGSTIFLGFSGNLKPSWTKLFTSPAGQGLGLLEQFIPLQLDEYGCPRASTVQRRDLELLKQTSKAH